MAATFDYPNRKPAIGQIEKYPVLASATIYEGTFVGLSSGYARGLVAGDTFVGVAVKQVEETTAVNGAEDVEVYGGQFDMECAVTGASAVTDVGSDVYISADDTLTLTAGSNTWAGYVKRWVTGTTCMVNLRTLGAFEAHEHTSTSDGGKLTSPRVVTGINDTNGMELMKVTATASAVNEITLANAATGNDPSLTASGGDTDVGIKWFAKGAGELTLNGPVVLSNVAGTGAGAVSAVSGQNIGVTSGNDLTLSAGPLAADLLNLQVYDVDATAYVNIVQAAGHATIPTLALAPSGTAIGFFGKTPATQQDNIAAAGLSAATQATTTEIRALSVAVDAAIALIKTFGFCATA